jgi:hypothetical protein
VYDLSDSYSTSATSATVESVADAQAVSLSPRSSITSEETEFMSKASEHIRRTSMSTTCPSSSSDDGVSAQATEDFVQTQFQKYITNTDDSGKTLMWHGMSTKFQVDPHLIGILDAIEAEDVGYLYLPQNNWEKKGKPLRKCRNKGYAFIHFMTEAAAADFIRKLTYNCTDKQELTETTEAVHQGISANLKMLITAPVKRTTDAVVYLPNSMNKLEGVSVSAFRDLLSASCRKEPAAS